MIAPVDIKAGRLFVEKDAVYPEHLVECVYGGVKRLTVVYLNEDSLHAVDGVDHFIWKGEEAKAFSDYLQTFKIPKNRLVLFNRKDRKIFVGLMDRLGEVENYLKEEQWGHAKNSDLLKPVLSTLKIMENWFRTDKMVRREEEIRKKRLDGYYTWLSLLPPFVADLHAKDPEPPEVAERDTHQ